MKAVETIALEGIQQTVQGLVKKGALVGFMLLVLGGSIFYFEREKRDCAQAIRQQAARIDTLTGQVMHCTLERVSQSYEIKALREQVNLLITTNTRRKR